MKRRECLLRKAENEADLLGGYGFSSRRRFAEGGSPQSENAALRAHG